MIKALDLVFLAIFQKNHTFHFTTLRTQCVWGKLSFQVITFVQTQVIDFILCNCFTNCSDWVWIWQLRWHYLWILWHKWKILKICIYPLLYPLGRSSTGGLKCEFPVLFLPLPTCVISKSKPSIFHKLVLIHVIYLLANTCSWQSTGQRGWREKENLGNSSNWIFSIKVCHMSVKLCRERVVLVYFSKFIFTFTNVMSVCQCSSFLL